MRRLQSRDGVDLALETRGEPDRPGIVFAHGFGQTRRAWAGSAAALAELGHFTVTFDARGHGDSGWREEKPYDWEQMGDDLVAVVGTFSSPPVLVGASMGGLVGLAAEGMDGPLFRALVLVDVTPRWEPRGLDRILNFMHAHPHGFDSLDQAAQAIATYLPHRSERKSPERLRALLEAGDDGRLRWHWDPRLLDELARGSESQQPLLFEAAKRIRIPTLLISGGASDVVSPATIEEFLSLVPHAQHVIVPHATHMVAGDDNIVFTQHVVQFLGTLRDKESRS